MNEIYKGNGFVILEENGKYQISWNVGIFEQAVYYDISKENAEKAMKSDEDASAVMLYASSGHWPISEEEKIELGKDFLRKFPQMLLKIPSNQRYFDREELEELLEKAKKQQ